MNLEKAVRATISLCIAAIIAVVGMTVIAVIDLYIVTPIGGKYALGVLFWVGIAVWWWNREYKR